MSEPRKPAPARPAAPARPPARPALRSPRRAPLAHEVDVVDPLAGLPDAGGVEESAAAEIDAIAAGFRARAAAEQRRFDAATGAAYYTVLVFEDSEQCAAFLGAVGQPGDGLFVDGREVAARLGIELPQSTVPRPKLGRVDATLASLAMPRDPKERG